MVLLSGSGGFKGSPNMRGSEGTSKLWRYELRSRVLTPGIGVSQEKPGRSQEKRPLKGSLAVTSSLRQVCDFPWAGKVTGQSVKDRGQEGPTPAGPPGCPRLCLSVSNWSNKELPSSGNF